MGQIGAEADDIAAIGITNQRETTICFSKKTGKPVYPAIVWQCRRTADKIDALKKDGFDKVIRERTGLIPDAYFSATKICWILEHVEGARQMAEDGELLFGTVDTWLMWNLTKGQVFATDYHVNVQPLSGTHANMTAYAALLRPGDTILSLDLQMGGHISHGLPISMTGRLYNIEHYGLDSRGYIDMRSVEDMAKRTRPKLIIAGASAYSRIIDFERFACIAHENGALLMADIAHIAGLVAAGEHPSPFGHADIITTTTHKTLRGIRSALIFCKQEYARKVDSALFPGMAGGPHMHTIAAKAVTAEEALTPEFRAYIRRVVENSRAMAAEFTRMGYEVVTGGTDNHMFLLDFTRTHPTITGQMVQQALDSRAITLNKNSVPGEKRSPMQTSGVRIGTAAMTTKGFGRDDFIAVVHRIDEIITSLSRE